MQFVDQIEIVVKAGNGGNGIVAFRREKYVPRGGPSGGNGGRGGNVVVRASRSLNTLVDLRYKKHYRAGHGGDGGPNDKHGANGKDLLLKVPVGTVVLESSSGKKLADLVNDGQRYVLAKGGEGGRGNASFATSTLQTPKFAEKGEQTEAFGVTLELKLIADVGIIGYPSVGKSTLISKISSARPKIADYPFTTLVPNLGVVRVDDRSFVVADMPGLIEGAHDGAGLGHQFLRHIERTRLLLHLIDVSGLSGRDASRDFDAINAELEAHSEKLARLPQIVALNKVDVPEAGETAARIRPALESRGLVVHEISSLTGAGLQPLLYRIADVLDSIPREEEVQSQVAHFTVEPDGESWNARRTAENEFVVEGRPVEKIVLRTDTGNEHALRYLHRQLERMGVIQKLRTLGARHGDLVRIRDLEFDFWDEAHE